MIYKLCFFVFVLTLTATASARECKIGRKTWITEANGCSYRACYIHVPRYCSSSWEAYFTKKCTELRGAEQLERQYQAQQLNECMKKGFKRAQ